MPSPKKKPIRMTHFSGWYSFPDPEKRGRGTTWARCADHCGRVEVASLDGEEMFFLSKEVRPYDAWKPLRYEDTHEFTPAFRVLQIDCPFAAGGLEGCAAMGCMCRPPPHELDHLDRGRGRAGASSLLEMENAIEMDDEQLERLLCGPDDRHVMCSVGTEQELVDRVCLLVWGGMLSTSCAVQRSCSRSCDHGQKRH